MGVWLLGDQLYWIFSTYSTNMLRCPLLPLKSLSHRSICYMETWNAVAVKMKCYSWNTYVITWTESPLQWNGCCLATNAKEEPECFSFFFSPTEGVLNIYHAVGGSMFLNIQKESWGWQWGHPPNQCHMGLVGQPVTDSNSVHCD